jgi:hypothetical protein
MQETPVKTLLLWIACVNTLSAIAVCVFVSMAAMGAIKGLQIGTDVGLTTENLRSLFEDVLQTASNVRNVTDNATPIAKSARIGVTTTNWTGVAAAAHNATASAAGVTRQQMHELVGNFTRAIGAVAEIKFSSITDLMADARDPETRRALRERVDHALRSFDFATAGAQRAMNALGEFVMNRVPSKATE